MESRARDRRAPGSITASELATLMAA